MKENDNVKSNPKTCSWSWKSSAFIEPMLFTGVVIGYPVYLALFS